MSPDDKIVSVPVPQRYLAAVYQVLRMAMAEAAPSVPEGNAPAVPDARSWTSDEIAQLKRTDLNPTSHTLLDLTTKRARDWAALRELEAHGSRTQRQVAADHAGLTKLIKRHFAKGSKKYGVPSWPLLVELGNPNDIITRYRMAPDVACWWREAT